MNQVIIQMKNCHMLPYNRLLLCVLSLLLVYHHQAFSIATDKIHSNQSICDGQTLTSAGGWFMLGFFSPNNSSTNRYVGIWYNLGSSEQVIVWVANREDPLTDTTGVVKLDQVTSNIVLTDASNTTLWSSNTTIGSTAGSNVTAKLQDYGNFVLLQDDGNEIWSSFNHLTDTFLPHSVLSFDLGKNTSNTLISWKSKFDPSPGNFTIALQQTDFHQAFIVFKGSRPHWRTGPWIDQRFIGIPNKFSSHWHGFVVERAGNRITFRCALLNDSVLLLRLVLTHNGQLVQWLWNERVKHWVLDWKEPEHECDIYGTCGEFAYCNPFSKTICNCMEGFMPRSSEDWAKHNFSGGCVRMKELACKRSQNGSGDEFLTLKRMKLPDLASWLDTNNETVCRQMCANNCSCLAYAFVDGDCMAWFKRLLDMRVFQEKNGEKLYVKWNPPESSSGVDERKKVIIISLVVPLGIIFFSFVLLLLMCKKRKKERLDPTNSSICNPAPIIKEQEVVETFENSHIEARGLELLRYDYERIMTATNDFSTNNKLGEGGFGPVYKGVLLGGQEIAVKRLSVQSRQGLREFNNEVSLISNLQHQNLVRLLGYCINVEDRLLIYEFMPNKSLDASLFGSSRSDLLSWSKRFDIIKGIAQGLLYLHRDSRLRIIHRDLKASNILLDAHLNPKISDFGIARIFDNDKILETNNVVGTCGYMSPEYIMHGQFSEKFDVYSFGVLLLEILSGARIGTFYDEQNSLNLLGYAWKLWNEGNVLQFVDMDLRDSWPQSNATKCITIALLCVQEVAKERPTMSFVAHMLTNDNVDLPTPNEPAFSGRRDPSISCSSSGMRQRSSAYGVTMTELEGR